MEYGQQAASRRVEIAIVWTKGYESPEFPELLVGAHALSLHSGVNRVMNLDRFAWHEDCALK